MCISVFDVNGAHIEEPWTAYMKGEKIVDEALACRWCLIQLAFISELRMCPCLIRYIEFQFGGVLCLEGLASYDS